MDKAQIEQKLERVDEILNGLEERLQALENVPTREDLMNGLSRYIRYATKLEGLLKEAGIKLPRKPKDVA